MGTSVIGMSFAAAPRTRTNTRTAAYLLGMPLLPDYLEEALDQFGETSTDDALGRL
jgi:hypothetical protein